MTPEEIAKEAETELTKYPPVAYRPDWHPYFWLGVLDAARRIRESENVKGNP